jgi:TPR repeat protein
VWYKTTRLVWSCWKKPQIKVIDALDVLGRHYYETEEYENRVSHWEKAAAQGQPNAQFGLGICYHDGRGV